MNGNIGKALVASVLALSLAACASGKPSSTSKSESARAQRAAQAKAHAQTEVNPQQIGELGRVQNQVGTTPVLTQKEVVRSETITQVLPTVEQTQVKADVNRMSADDFMSLGLPGNIAQNVVNYRNEHGPFKSLDDLKRVPSMDVGWLNQNRGRLATAG